MKNVPQNTTSSRPNSNTFWSSYLNYDQYPQRAQIWNTIGGSVGRSYGPEDEHTCAARVSYGLNYGGAPVVSFGAASVNLATQEYNGKPGDGKRYIVSAMQLANYLNKQWEQPDHRVTTEAQLDEVVRGLGSKSAIFATPSPPGGRGHAGVLKVGYTDPHVREFLTSGVDVWVLN